MKNIVQVIIVLGSLILLNTSITLSQWLQSYGGTFSVGAIAVSVDNLFVGTNSYGVFKTSNNGDSWSIVNSGLPNNYGTYFGINDLAVTDTNLYAATNIGVYISTNRGNSWSEINNGLNTGQPFYSIVTNGKDIYAGNSSTVYRSTNNGLSWTPNAPNPLGKSGYVYDLIFSGTNLFAATLYGGVLISTDNGSNWNAVNNGLPVNNGFTYARVLTVSGENLFVGTGNGVFYSTNNGANWTEVNNGLWNTNVFSFAITGKNIFVGTLGGVFHSINNGTSWVNISSGLTNSNVFALGILGKTIYAGVNYAISYRPLSELFTSAKRSTSDLFTQYYLEQNYPNPFNPSTKISFSLPQASNVTLKVIDALGREVSILVNEFKSEGTYNVQFNGSSLSSGVYFYRLQARQIEGGQAGSYVDTKKLILMK